VSIAQFRFLRGFMANLWTDIHLSTDSHKTAPPIDDPPAALFKPQQLFNGTLQEVHPAPCYERNTAARQPG
jgi:hypothetical protein